jgi:putative intracellular protease/amidase
VKPKVCVLVFDGLADWEPALALCEIRRSGKFDVVTVGFSPNDVVTMGGFRVAPDTTLDAVDWAQAALLILPGGDMWEQGERPGLKTLLPALVRKNVPVAAICGATLEVARTGLTRGARHTSNALNYLKSMVPSYSDESMYVDQLAVSDHNLITASGLGSVEFAREILRRLGVYDDADLTAWFDIFKRGVIPAAYQS